MAEPDDLLAAVDKLTRPLRTKIIQDGLDTPHTVTLTALPLLTQLEDAVAGTIGIGGSASLPNERNMLDSDALHRFMTIQSTIYDWARAVRATVHLGDPGRTLRSWYVAYAAAPRELESTQFHEGKLQAWIAEIEAKLDPPRVRELPDRCPSCDAFVWYNPRDKMQYMHPLVIEYRPTGPDMVQDAIGKCRACDTRWGVRQLAYEIEQAFIADWDEAIAADQLRHAGVSLG